MNDNMSDPVNWVGDVAPQAGDYVKFNATSILPAKLDAAFQVQVERIFIDPGDEGTVTLDRSYAVDTFTMNDPKAKLDGVGDLTIDINGKWYAGSFLGGATAGKIIVAAGASFEIDSIQEHIINNRVFENAGRVYWKDGNIRLDAGAKINNLASSWFYDQTTTPPQVPGLPQMVMPHTISTLMGTLGQFNLYTKVVGGVTTTAQYVKSLAGLLPPAGTTVGTTEIWTLYSNDGRVQLDAGSLRLNGGGLSLGPARFILAQDTGLYFGGGTHQLQGGTTIEGSGAVELTSGALDILNGNVTVDHFRQSGVRWCGETATCLSPSKRPSSMASRRGLAPPSSTITLSWI